MQPNENLLKSGDLLEQELRSDEEHPSQFLGTKGVDHKMEEMHEDADANGRGYGNKEGQDLSNTSNNEEHSGYGRLEKQNVRYYEMDEVGSNLLSDMNSLTDSSILSIPQNKWRAKLYQLNA